MEINACTRHLILEKISKHPAADSEVMSAIEQRKEKTAFSIKIKEIYKAANNYYMMIKYFF